MSDLMPCPFCGSTNAPAIFPMEVLDRDPDLTPGQFAVICDATQKGCGGMGGACAGEKDAIAAWNRRAATADARAGWVLVPVEPTIGMLVNGFEAVSAFQDTDEYKEMSGCRGATESARVCYAHMLAAAPEARPMSADGDGVRQLLVMALREAFQQGDRHLRHNITPPKNLAERAADELLGSPEWQAAWGRAGAVERDAVRYRYLRDNFDGFDAGHGEPPRYVLTFQFPPGICVGLGDRFDAAIDEALRAGGEAG